MSRRVRDGPADYRLSEHRGIGAGREYFNLNNQANETGGTLVLEFQFSGLAVFGYAAF